MEFRRFSKWLVLLLCLAVPAQTFAQRGNVRVHPVNGYQDNTVITCYNVLDIEIENDEELTGISLGFEISYPGTILFDSTFTDDPAQRLYVKQFERAAYAFDLTNGAVVDARFDGVSPDTILITASGTSGGGGMPPGPPSLAYQLSFFVLEGDTIGGVSVDNIFVPTSGTWSFEYLDSTSAPDFCSEPNSSEADPDAPPVSFPYVVTGALSPIWTQTPGAVVEADHCDGYSFDFDADEGGNVPPALPLEFWSDIGAMDSESGEFSIMPDCPSGPNPQEVTVYVRNMACQEVSYTFQINWTNNDPQLTFCPTYTGKVKVGQTYDYPFAASDADACDSKTFSTSSVGDAPVGSYGIDANGYFTFAPDAADDGQSFDFEVAVTDPCGGSDVCQFSVLVEMPLCGDVNGDGYSNITDAVYIILFIFAGGNPPNPLFVGDVNCDGIANITDVIYFL